MTLEPGHVPDLVAIRGRRALPGVYGRPPRRRRQPSARSRRDPGCRPCGCRSGRWAARARHRRRRCGAQARAGGRCGAGRSGAARSPSPAPCAAGPDAQAGQADPCCPAPHPAGAAQGTPRLRVGAGGAGSTAGQPFAGPCTPCPRISPPGQPAGQGPPPARHDPRRPPDHLAPHPGAPAAVRRRPGPSEARRARREPRQRPRRVRAGGRSIHKPPAARCPLTPPATADMAVPLQSPDVPRVSFAAGSVAQVW